MATKNNKIDWKTNTFTMTKKFAAEANDYGSEAYNILMDVRSKGFHIAVRQPKERKACPTRVTFKQMEIILSCMFERVKKLSRVQPMPYKYVKTWFENLFPYYSEQPTLDADGYVIDPVTLPNMKSMVQEVAAANQTMIVEAKVA